MISNQKDNFSLVKGYSLKYLANVLSQISKYKTSMKGQTDTYCDSLSSSRSQKCLPCTSQNLTVALIMMPYFSAFLLLATSLLNKMSFLTNST